MNTGQKDKFPRGVGAVHGCQAALCGAGFTLIEIMVCLALVGLLLALGLPAMNGIQTNSKIRAHAGNFNASLQFARTESMRRNGGVEWVLTDDAPVAANVSAATLSASGKNSMVRWTATGAAPYVLLQGIAGQEGGGASSVTVSGSAPRVAFNGLGGVEGGVATSFDFASGSSDCVAGGGPMRCLRVQVSSGGQVRLCDPAVTAPGDARTCS